MVPPGSDPEAFIRRHSNLLRQALGYRWSVAVAALLEEGLDRLERWVGSGDPDVRWFVRDDLKKRRLIAVAGGRLERWRALVGAR